MNTLRYGYYNYYTSGELYHYGIKGMRWGVRRFQNEDGSLTKAGEKRYGKEVTAAKEKLKQAKQDAKNATYKYNATSAFAFNKRKQASKNLINANYRTQWAKEDLKNEKIKVDMKYDKKQKSNRRLKLEQEYVKKGMTKEEAELAAYKRSRTEKILAISAGVSIAAIGAYVAYKHHDNVVDKLIKPGTLLQNISTDPNKGVADAFYASLTKGDNAAYRGLYGDTLRRTGRDVVETKILASGSGLKMASPKRATAALESVIKSDPDGINGLKLYFIQNRSPLLMPEQSRALDKGIKALEKGVINTDVYKAFNLTLPDHTNVKGERWHKSFYDVLKLSGYDAILDINDKELSGYHSRKPVIVFNPRNVSVLDKRVVDPSEIKRDLNRTNTKLMTLATSEAAVKQLAGGAGGAAAVAVARNAYNDAIVRKYRKKHPDTTMSYTEIVRSQQLKK